MRKRWAELPVRLGTKRESVFDDVPTRVRNTNRTTAGPINGKITENVLANVIASIQAAIANNGLYDLGYVAIEKDQKPIIINKRRESYHGSAGGASLLPFLHSGPVANAEAEA